MIEPRIILLGDPEITAKSVLQFCVSVLRRLRDLQYIFAVTSGSPSTSRRATAYEMCHKINIWTACTVNHFSGTQQWEHFLHYTLATWLSDTIAVQIDFLHTFFVVEGMVLI